LSCYSLFFSVRFSILFRREIINKKIVLVISFAIIIVLYYCIHTARSR
jgi:hypothetical protein